MPPPQEAGSWGLWPASGRTSQGQRRRPCCPGRGRLRVVWLQGPVRAALPAHRRRCTEGRVPEAAPGSDESWWLLSPPSGQQPGPAAAPPGAFRRFYPPCRERFWCAEGHWSTQANAALYKVLRGPGVSLIFQICENTPGADLVFLLRLGPAWSRRQSPVFISLGPPSGWAGVWAEGVGAASPQEPGALVVLFQGKELCFHNRSNS